MNFFLETFHSILFNHKVSELAMLLYNFVDIIGNMLLLLRTHAKLKVE